MCSTCGCGKKADTFEAPKRQRIGNRFISRRKDGTISKNVDVGRSLSADRRKKAKTTASAGQGDKGDLKRAEESCPKCKAAVSMDTTMLDTYYLCGDCDIAWYDGGRDNPITIREFQWIQNNPIQHYGVSREEVEELYGKDSNYINYEGEEFGAESKFDKLSNEIAKDYEKKGKSKDEAEEIGKATAYKIGVAKYGKRGMERKARAGRAKNAESFGADGIDMNRNRDKSHIHYQLYNDPTFRQRLSFGLSNPSYGGYIGYTTNPYESDAVGLNIGYYSYGKNIKTGEQWEQWAKGRLTPEQFNDFEQGVEDGMDSSPDAYEDFDGGLECGCGATATVAIDKGNVHSCAYCFGVMVGKAKVEIPIIEEAISENMGAESFGADEKKRRGMNIAPKIQMVDYKDIMTEKMKNQDMKDAEEFGADGYFPDDSYYGIDEMTYVKRPHHVAYIRKAHAERPMDKGFEYPNMHTDQNKQGKIWDDRSGFRKMDSKERGLFEEIGGKISDFDVDYTIVQRPHHVARVRNDRIGGGKHGLEQWNQPTMHTDQNKLGKMYDEEKGGWVQMDDKARSMFEEIGGKISDFDVVGTTQDVVGKTGFNIPTGVASIAVVFMAYMTGKKYGN